MSLVRELEIVGLRHEPNDLLVVDLETVEGDAWHFIQGQYLTLNLMIDGEEQRRSYSLCSAPQTGLQIGIKRVPGGTVSEYAHRHFQVGVRVESFAPAGNFYLPLQAGRARRYLMLAAGSGITPIIAHIRAILRDEPRSQITLLYGNRVSTEIAFVDALQWLKNRYVSRLQWFNVFSRQHCDNAAFAGRIDAARLRLLDPLLDLRGKDAIFVCGPQGMSDEVATQVRALGMPPDVLRTERFFNSAEDAQEALHKRAARAVDYADLDSRVRVRAQGREVAFDLAATGHSVLDGAIEAGLDLPFSCKGGVCATCKARLLEGEVQMDVNHALDDDEVRRGYVLTCQAHPLSDGLLVDFDVS
ncbi:MAG: 2Fe-2S iron-sulfur cluster-binding protein [Pseudomonadota bacterium]